MRVAWSWLPCLLVFAAACQRNAPSSPSSLAQNYTLEVQLSTECPPGQIGPPVYRPHPFVMQATVTNGEWIFNQVPWKTLSGGTSAGLVLRLSVEGARLSGSLAGAGLAGDASLLLSIAAEYSPGLPPQGAAIVTGEGRLGIEPVAGHFAGYVGMSVYGLNAAAACTATDHTWRLLPY